MSGEIDPDIMDLRSIGGGTANGQPLTGIRALMLAVLDNAISNYLGSAAPLREEAELWINSHSRRSPFSFSIVCETLGLDSEAVRTALHRWRVTAPAAPRIPGRRRPNVTRGGRVIPPKAS